MPPRKRKCLDKENQNHLNFKNNQKNNKLITKNNFKLCKVQTNEHDTDSDLTDIDEEMIYSAQEKRCKKSLININEKIENLKHIKSKNSNSKDLQEKNKKNVVSYDEDQPSTSFIIHPDDISAAFSQDLTDVSKFVE